MRRIAVAAVAIGVVGLTAALALAAAPKKNGLYDSNTVTHGLTKRVELHVSATGKRATANVYCENALARSLKSFPILRGGKFNAHDKYNTIRLTGRFVTQQTAKATLHMQGVCDEAAGANFRLVLKLSPNGR
jgi:hypothetical protein